MLWHDDELIHISGIRSGRQMAIELLLEANVASSKTARWHEVV